MHNHRFWSYLLWKYSISARKMNYIELIYYYTKELNMRRSDREIIDINKINEIIQNCYCIRIGIYDNGHIYIVPVNFGHKVENNIHTFYFHGVSEGRKYTLAKENPRIGFELDTGFLLCSAKTACKYTAQFQSIIGEGKLSIVSDSKEKEEGLLEIMKQNTNSVDWSFNLEQINKITVYKIDVEQLSCKEHE